MTIAIIKETPRLVLRHFTSDDLNDLTPILADAEVMRYSLSGVKTRSQTKDFINWMLDLYQKKNLGLYALIQQKDRQLIGYCGLLEWDFEGIEEVEIGYRLARKYWGRGLATEAAIAVRDYAWNELKIDKLICLIESENIRSIRVAEKLGMNYEKTMIFKGLNVRVYRSTDNKSHKREIEI
jgi:[ribosomal protein S5]-alanine N-acetyltransferase